MSVARQGVPGATRVCPHCKATVLASADICPGCQHHLRFNTLAAEPRTLGRSAMRLEGTIEHSRADEPCEYCLIVSVSNEQGHHIARQVVGVGALKPGERHSYSFSIDVTPVHTGLDRVRAAPDRKKG